MCAFMTACNFENKSIIDIQPNNIQTRNQLIYLSEVIPVQEGQLHQIGGSSIERYF